MIRIADGVFEVGPRNAWGIFWVFLVAGLGWNVGRSIEFVVWSAVVEWLG